MTDPAADADPLRAECAQMFAWMTESVGVKKFSESLDISTRQVNRILSGAQPNPLERLIRSLQACTPEVGDKILDYIGQEMGGYFVRAETIELASINAVRECAEAIAAISDGHISKIDEQEIREAISALISLARIVKETGRRDFPPPTI
jgi:plasmid maintenance system antidote protein VapI